MIATSRVFTKIATDRLSYLSAICPQVAEKSRNGRMKRPAMRFTTSAGLTVEFAAA